MNRRNETFTPKYGERDTLVIQTNEVWLQIYHFYHGVELMNFFLKAGDTAVFRYDNLVPILSVRNRQSKAYDLNFQYLKNKSCYKGGFPPQIKCQFLDVFNEDLPKIKDPIAFKKLYDKIQQECHHMILASFKSEIIFLDSIYNEGLMSKEIYQMYRSIYQYRLKSYEVVSASKIDKKPINTPISRTLPEFSDRFFKDSLGALSYLMSVVNEKVGKLKDPKLQGLNYMAIYDTLASINNMGNLVKAQILTQTMEQIVQTNSASEVQSYLKKFEQDVLDSTRINEIKQKYGLNSKITDTLYLKNVYSQVNNLKTVLLQKRGKLIYVDFWATWCAPCVASLPASAELRSAYAGKDIEFLYISKDENYDRWLKGIEKHGINNANSFIIDNLHTSKFLDDLKIDFIPRYLLYDRNGNLVHRNAPGPEDPKLKVLLDSYLNKK
jgi:thiol-disulfide isomerase/thioredoxin